MAYQAAPNEGRLGRLLHVHIPEVWLRFLLALAGLVAAFGAALFSTVSRESGNAWATLIFASTALLLAMIVGLTTVPYLARQVVTARLRDALDYEVTRFGIVYFVALLIIAIPALNTGNNLLYIIVAAMLAAILVSGIASTVVLRGLELDVRLPEHVFARRPVLCRAVVRNKKRWLPSFSLSLVSLKRPKPARRWRWVRTKFAFPPKAPWVRLPDWKLGRAAQKEPLPEIFQGALYFPYIRPNGEAAADLRLCFDRRGLYQQDKFGLSTRFPFAFFAKTRRVPLAREIIVYPSVDPPNELFEVLPLLTGEFEVFARGRGSDLYRIREHMPGDSARHVDWKATAKSGSLKVREFSREDERRLRIVFDNPQEGAVGERAYENAVTLIASLAWHFSTENTELSFVSPGYEGGTDVYQFLRYLALVRPGAGEFRLEGLPISDDYNVIVTTRPRGTIPTALWACSYFVFVEEEGVRGVL